MFDYILTHEEQKDQIDGYDSYYGYGDDDDKNPDLTRALFDFEGLDFVGSFDW